MGFNASPEQKPRLHTFESVPENPFYLKLPRQQWNHLGYDSAERALSQGLGASPVVLAWLSASVGKLTPPCFTYLGEMEIKVVFFSTHQEFSDLKLHCFEGMLGIPEYYW